MLSAKVIQPQDVPSRLASLAEGLSLEVLVRTIQAAVIGFDSTSPLAPPTVPGTNFWGEAVSHLREELLPRGWEACDAECFSTVVSPCKAVRIACGRGISGVGDPNPAVTPTTRSKKGPRTIAAIHANSNRGQGAFDFVREPEVGATWFLLYERKNNLVYAELSLPGSFCEINRRPDGWIERIPLPPISIDPAGFDDVNDAPDFEVPVNRRT